MPLLVRRRDIGPRGSLQQHHPQPLRELEDLQEQTAQLLQQLWGSAAPDMPAPWVPDVDIEEADDAWIVEAELPGARAEDIHVEVHEGELTIRGEIVEREREGILRRRSRRVGQFEYHVALPGLTDAAEPEARLRQGVLSVRVPKPEVSRPREIRIQDGGAEREQGMPGGGQPAGQSAGAGSTSGS
jgi:HSP20 family protein